MHKCGSKKGTILLVVLSVVMFAVMLTSIILNTMTSQSRLTHHRVSRMQAYYAVLSGVNYAYEKLRLGNDANWPMPTLAKPSNVHTLCNGCNGPGDIDEPNLPLSVQNVTIAVVFNGSTVNVPGTTIPIPGCSPCNASPLGINVCVCSYANYTFTSP